MDKNKKTILIISATIGAILLLALIIFAVYQYFSSPQGVYSSLRAIAIENNYATSSDFSGCNARFADGCNADVINTIIVGVKTDLNSFEVNNDSLENDLTTFSDTYGDMKPQELLSGVKNLIKKKGDVLSAKLSSLESIKKLVLSGDTNGYSVGSFKIVSNWAGIVVTPPDPNTADSAGYLLEKVNNKWQIKLGPGTSFTESDFADLNPVADVGNEETVGTPSTVVPQEIVDFFTYGNADQGEIH